MYFDAHTHLNEDRLFSDWQKHLQQFVDVGGKGLINVGVDENRNQRAVEIAQMSRQKLGDQVFVKATIGIHPSEVSFGKISTSKQIKESIDELRKLYEKHPNEIVAIGECGVDAHYPDYDQHTWLQQELFDAQCSLARELKLPIVTHSRDQFNNTLEVIKSYTDLKVYFHCRWYGPDEIVVVHNLLPNFRFGCCGNITYPAADELRNSLKKGVELSLQLSPNSHIIHRLLETDAPYLTPQKNRGELNTPAQIVDIYEYMAQMLNITSIDIQERVKKSFESLYVK